MKTKPLHPTRLALRALALRTFLLAVAAMAALTRCASDSPPGEPTRSELAQMVERLQETVKYLEVEVRKNRSGLASLANENQALREKLEYARRDLEVLRGKDPSLKKGKPPYESSPSLGFEHSTGDESEKIPESARLKRPSGDKSPLAPPSPALTLGRISEWSAGAHEDGDPAAHPSSGGDLLAQAQAHMARGQYPEALEMLTQLRARHPQLEDRGESLLLEAEAWLRQGEFPKVDPPLRIFYSRYSQSPWFLRAKLLEAQAREGQGLKIEATGLFREIIAMGPQSPEAEKARAGLQRLRESR